MVCEGQYIYLRTRRTYVICIFNFFFFNIQHNYTKTTSQIGQFILNKNTVDRFISQNLLTFDIRNIHNSRTFNQVDIGIGIRYYQGI